MAKASLVIERIYLTDYMCFAYRTDAELMLKLRYDIVIVRLRTSGYNYSIVEIMGDWCKDIGIREEKKFNYTKMSPSQPNYRIGW